MKTFAISMCLIFIGCGLANEKYFTRSFDLNSPIETTVGGIMIQWESGMKNTVYGWRFDGIRKSLVYGGIASNVIKVSYREYYVDERIGGVSVARQPFYQELQYDLSQSKIITFQDIRIEVESANSEKIRFKVLQTPTGFENAQKEIR